MIGHVSIQALDLAASTAFFKQDLQPLNLSLLVTRAQTVGFGKRYPEFWLNHCPDLPQALPGTGAHVRLRTASRDAAYQFHVNAIPGVGPCDGPPGQRNAAMTTYYGAFVLDLDGNRIQAVTFPR